MGYDIGIGLCTHIKGREISVGLDSAMLGKLRPGSPWLKSGTSSLTFDSRLCSTKRPLNVGEEVYLSAAAIEKKAAATLDLAGASENVDLRVLLHGLEPMPAPAPTAKRAYGAFSGKARR